MASAVSIAPPPNPKQAAPECRYFVGEHSASGFLPWDYGGLDREQNGSYNRPQPYEVRAMHVEAARYYVREMHIDAAAFGVFDLRGGASAFWHYQVELGRYQVELVRTPLLLRFLLLLLKPNPDPDPNPNPNPNPHQVSKLLLLIKLVLEPQGAASSQAFANTAPIEWQRAKLFVPATLGPMVELLREANLFTEDDGSPLRILQEPSLI
eukprot:scaffold32922_cov61-Phaeocystis_antarctica.AAC.1